MKFRYFNKSLHTIEHKSEIVVVSHNLIGLEFELGECKQLGFYGRALSLLWSLSTDMRISLGVVWFKNVFRVCTGLLRTAHDLIKT